MPARARSQSLTRDEIVAAALRLTRDEGFSRLTMRSVAADLGVTPMALYYYIEGKDDLTRLVIEEAESSRLPLELGEDGWEASLRRHLLSLWEGLAPYPGLGAYLIEQPFMRVTPEGMKAGIRFFEEAGFEPTNARLAWSFALTYIHGRLNVDARLWHQPDAPRIEGLHAHDFVAFGVDAVIQGLRGMLAAQGGEDISARRDPSPAHARDLRQPKSA